MLHATCYKGLVHDFSFLFLHPDISVFYTRPFFSLRLDSSVSQFSQLLGQPAGSSTVPYGIEDSQSVTVISQLKVVPVPDGRQFSQLKQVDEWNDLQILSMHNEELFNKSW